MSNSVRQAEQRMENACRVLNHTVKEFTPWIRGGLSATFLTAAQATTGNTQIACYAIAALSTLSASKSLIEDFGFWAPPIKGFYAAKSSLKNAVEQAAEQASEATPPSP